MVCAGSSSARASNAPDTVAWGAKSPPMASNAIRANSGFLCCYPLLAVVIPTLGADMMRTLHRLATRTLLDRDSGRSLVRVARALLSLGGTSLRDGHIGAGGRVNVVGWRRVARPSVWQPANPSTCQPAYQQAVKPSGF